jgi:hypothetical protein
MGRVGVRDMARLRVRVRVRARDMARLRVRVRVRVRARVVRLEDGVSGGFAAIAAED